MEMQKWWESPILEEKDLPHVVWNGGTFSVALGIILINERTFPERKYGVYQHPARNQYVVMEVCPQCRSIVRDDKDRISLFDLSICTKCAPADIL